MLESGRSVRAARAAERRRRVFCASGLALAVAALLVVGAWFAARAAHERGRREEARQSTVRETKFTAAMERAKSALRAGQRAPALAALADAAQSGAPSDAAITALALPGEPVVCRRITEPDAPTKGPRSVEFSPDGRLLVTASTDGPRLYDAASGAALLALTAPRCTTATFDPLGRALLAGTWQPDEKRGALLRWEMRADGADFVLNRASRLGPGVPHERIAQNRDGTLLVAASGSPAKYFLHRRDGEAQPVEDSAGFRKFALSPDGRTLAASHQREGGIVFWSLSTMQRTRDLPSDTESGLAFSPDGAALAVSTPAYVTHLWDLRALRSELAKLALDWDAPPLPPASRPPPVRVRLAE